MASNTDSQQQLCQCLQSTINPDATIRKNAETYLRGVQTQPGFSSLLFQVLSSAGVNPAIRQAGAVLFKNLVKFHWEPSDDSVQALSAADKDFVRGQLLTAILESPKQVQAQLMEALTLISQTDFPSTWKTLPEQLASYLSCPDPQKLITVLSALHGITKRYRHAFGSSELNEEIIIVLQAVTGPMFTLFQSTIQSLSSGAVAQNAAGPIYEILNLIVKMYLSLNSQDVPEFFEDNNTVFMNGFLYIMSLSAPGDAEAAAAAASKKTTNQNKNGNNNNDDDDDDDDDDDSDVHPLHHLQGAVCECLELYTCRYEDDFRPFFQPMLTAVWNLMSRLGNAARFDSLFIRAVQFLSAVAKSVYGYSFNEPGIITSIVQNVVLPHVSWRSSDILQFDDNPIEYIRNDQEKTEVGSRRYACTEFMRTLLSPEFANNVRTQRAIGTQVPGDASFETAPFLTSIAVEYVKHLYTEYESNPTSVSGCRAYDAAMFLIENLSTKTRTQAQGIMQLHNFFDLTPVFAKYAVPMIHQYASVIRSGTVATPLPAHVLIVIADSLRFVTAFRRHIDRASITNQVLPAAVSLLTCSNPVVSSYAAIFIDKFLTIRDSVTDIAQLAAAITAAINSSSSDSFGKNIPRFGVADVRPHIDSIMQSLLSPQMLAQLVSNEYMMKCLMRIAVVCSDGSLKPYIRTCLERIATFLNATSSTEANSASLANTCIQHYMFETLSALIRNHAGSEVMGVAEELLFPVFQQIFVHGVNDIIPYVFQVLMQLLTRHHELDPTTLPPAYMGLFANFLHVNFWNTGSYVGPLTKLIQVYILFHQHVISPATLDPLLGVFQKLCASKLTDHHGFDLLQALFTKVPLTTLHKYLNGIFRILLTRLQASRTGRFVTGFLRSCMIFAFVHGASNLIKIFDEIQPKLFSQILLNVGLSHLPRVEDPLDRKIISAGLIHVVLETSVTSPLFMEPTIVQQSSTLFASLRSLLVDGFSSGDDDNDDVDDDLDEIDIGGYTHQFAHLVYSQADLVDKKYNIFIHLGIDNPLDFTLRGMCEKAAHPAVRAFLVQLNPEVRRGFADLGNQQNIPVAQILS